MQTYVMKKGETLFPECYIKQKTPHGQRAQQREYKKHQQYKTDNTTAQNNT